MASRSARASPSPALRGSGPGGRSSPCAAPASRAQPWAGTATTQTPRAASRT